MLPKPTGFYLELADASITPAPLPPAAPTGLGIEFISQGASLPLAAPTGLNIEFIGASDTIPPAAPTGLGIAFINGNAGTASFLDLFGRRIETFGRKIAVS